MASEPGLCQKLQSRFGKAVFQVELLNAGFTDDDLPLTKNRDQLLQAPHKPGGTTAKIFKPQKEWEPKKVADFELKRWWVLSPSPIAATRKRCTSGLQRLSERLVPSLPHTFTMATTRCDATRQ
ncbi:hypothetical protein MKZ38_004715 [Zalerion maritima]|uniref:Uncharacterized protein n=1 Tax=Zalerion maritima TaxID=339359 RepID=A0AAD5WQS0_9PEZI|nr:hypothetical protein MKZ38_004715 [Zalerion maritima]